MPPRTEEEKTQILSEYFMSSENIEKEHERDPQTKKFGGRSAFKFKANSENYLFEHGNKGTNIKPKYELYNIFSNYPGIFL